MSQVSLVRHIKIENNNVSILMGSDIRLKSDHASDDAKYAGMRLSEPAFMPDSLVKGFPYSAKK